MGSVSSVQIPVGLLSHVQDWSATREATSDCENWQLWITSGVPAKTVYEDGTVVLVNYGRQSYTVDGVEVGAMDYLARKGAE